MTANNFNSYIYIYAWIERDSVEHVICKIMNKPSFFFVGTSSKCEQT